MHTFTPDGTPLGTIQAIPWARDDDDPKKGSKTRSQRAATPIEAKESYRWLLSMRQARVEAARCPGTRFVAVADSESDIYDVIAEGMEEPRTADWIIRSCQDRAAGRRSVGGPGQLGLPPRGGAGERRCSTGGRSRSVVGLRRWPARIATDVSRGSRARRSSRSERSGSRSAPRSGRPGNWPMPR